MCTISLIRIGVDYILIGGSQTKRPSLRKRMEHVAARQTEQAIAANDTHRVYITLEQYNSAMIVLHCHWKRRKYNGNI